MRWPNMLRYDRGNQSSSSHRFYAALAGLLLAAGPALAQEVIAPVTAPPATPPAVQEYQNSNPMQVFIPAEAGAPAEKQPFQWGSVVARPHLDYQFIYGNGIESSPGQQQNTVVQTISPGLRLDVGRHWTLDYTPSLSFYSSHQFRDTVNHSAQLGWGSTYEDWFFSGSQSYVSSSAPLVQTGGQTDQENYSTALNASYQMNDKMSLDLGLNQNLNFVGNGGVSTNLQLTLTDSKTWSTLDWLNYQFAPGLYLGLGAGLGYTIQDGAPDSLAEQYLGRVNWRATAKVSFQLSGGLQDEQYLSGGTSDLVTPVFAATVQYQPFEQTRLSLTASRSTSRSFFQGQEAETTSVSGDLNQRLLGKLHLELSGGYTATRYVATQAGATSRNDDGYNFNARLACPFLKRGTASVFYQYSENSSTQSGFAAADGAFAYTSHQIGFEISYRY
jgi:hypothetical protein